MLFSLNSSCCASTETFAPVTSTSSLLKKTSKKDCFTTSGALHSQYSFGGSALALLTLPVTTKSKSTKHDAVVAAITGASKGKKAPYGALCSSHGFGRAPVSSRKASWLSEKLRSDDLFVV